MTDSPHDAFLLGRMDSKLDSLVASMTKMEKTSDNHEDRISALEDADLTSRTRWKTLAWIITGSWAVIIAVGGLILTAISK